MQGPGSGSLTCGRRSAAAHRPSQPQCSSATARRRGRPARWATCSASGLPCAWPGFSPRGWFTVAPPGPAAPARWLPMPSATCSTACARRLRSAPCSGTSTTACRPASRPCACTSRPLPPSGGCGVRGVGVLAAVVDDPVTGQPRLVVRLSLAHPAPAPPPPPQPLAAAAPA
jgi:hypothetical protein